MHTTLVEIKDNVALSFLHDLERMHVLRIISENTSKPTHTKLSERFAGCLSGKRADELQQELTQMRNEWQRDTF